MTCNFISKLENLKKLKYRFEENRANGVAITSSKKFTDEECTWDYWINVVDYCIRCDLNMDETDYSNSPKEVKACWKGLKDKCDY